MKNNMIESGKLPVKNDIRILYVLSLIIAFMVAFVSVIGILYPKSIYPSEDLFHTFFPNDIVNLIAGLPFLLISLWLAGRGKLIGLLCWPGAIFYVLYVYFPYIICVPFNILFIPYLVLFSLSIYTLIGIVAIIESNVVSQQLSGNVSARISGGILIGLAVLSISRQSALMVNTLINKTIMAPQLLAQCIDDFTLLPVLFLGGFFLWKKKPLGYVAGAGLLIVYGVLSLGLIPLLVIQSSLKNKPLDISAIIIVAVMALICLIPFAFFLKAVNNVNKTNGKK
ncbi:MAG TPA: hypothetical protein VHY08_10180 [Bacillota bacterium]|nr:hypothetical protein [Bacillota bacterium]